MAPSAWVEDPGSGRSLTPAPPLPCPAGFSVAAEAPPCSAAHLPAPQRPFVKGGRVCICATGPDAFCTSERTHRSPWPACAGWGRGAGLCSRPFCGLPPLFLPVPPPPFPDAASHTHLVFLLSPGCVRPTAHSAGRGVCVWGGRPGVDGGVAGSRGDGGARPQPRRRGVLEPLPALQSDRPC